MVACDYCGDEITGARVKYCQKPDCLKKYRAAFIRNANKTDPRYIERKKEYSRKWHQSEKGKEAQRRATAKYNSNPEHKALAKERAKQYYARKKAAKLAETQPQETT